MCSSKVHYVTTHILHLETILQKSVLKNNRTYFTFKNLFNNKICSIEKFIYNFHLS